MSSPNIAELVETLHNLVDWELVAVHLRKLETTEIEKIQREESTIERQKLLLYERWLAQYPDATWNDVVTALEKGQQITLAKKVAEKILSRKNTPVPSKNETIMFSEKEEDEDKVIEELEELHESFTKLFQEVDDEIEAMLSSKKTTLHQIATRVSNAKIIGLDKLMNCQTIVELVHNFRINSSYLDGSVLNSIVKYGLPDNTALQTKTKEHMEKAKVFKRRTIIKTLKRTLNEKIEEDPAQTTLIVKLNNDWDKVTFNHVEELILALAGTHARAVRVKNGSVEITFMISRNKVMCFNITAQKRQLMCLIGVLYLQVGDERLFTEDENMNYTFENGLLEAAKVGHIQATEFILNMNIVNVNHQDNEGRTALMLASEHGHIEVLKLILSAGANVNIRNKIGETAVMVAKTVEIYQTLVQAKNADTSIVTHKGSTLLMASCLLGNHEVANHLLFTLNHALNHEITARPDGMTLLMAASQGGNQRIVEHLLINGADPNVQNNYGVTAIMLSCLYGHYTVTEILLKYKADPNVADNDGWIPLMVASQEGHHKIVQMLLVQERVHPNTTHIHGETALMHASQNGHTKIVELLLLNGADPNIQNNDGVTAIWLSCFNGHYTAMEILLKHNADPNIPNKNGLTPLMAADQEGHDEIVHMLLVQETVDLNEAGRPH